jgi:nucleoside-diphosphate-sugar epimerase
VYGLKDFTDADESTPLDGRARNPYPRSKIRAEQAIRSMLSPSQYVILRPGAVWGEGDRTILPRIIDHLRHSSSIIHFGKWRGRNRWPLAHVRNVATAAYLASCRDETAGQTYNVVDPEFTTMDQYYRLIVEHVLKDRSAPQSRTLPLWVSLPLAATSTFLSNLLHRDHPLFEPTLYGLRSVAYNLDFNADKLQRLFAAHAESFVDRPSGLAELALDMQSGG